MSNVADKAGFLFSKVEGTGNDFILVHAENASEFTPERVRSLCDRHYGIGADGVILILPARETAEASRRMLILNADGSIPEMCGNGIRCVALAVTKGSYVSSRVLIETDAGLRECAVERNANTGQVTVDMGSVRVLNTRLLEVQNRKLSVVEATAGNPHAILFGAFSREVMASLGPALCTHPEFPQGTNVEFASVRDREIHLVVWERGVGFTLACGTGAAATAVAAWDAGLLPRGETIVHLPGGPLTISPGVDDHVSMRGPARIVFNGSWP
jgi:diaminopimelate epimerase